MHPRSKHLVLLIFFLFLIVLLIGLLVTKVEAPEYDEMQNASVFWADTEMSFRVEHANGHTHMHERDAFITKVRSTLPEETPNAGYEDVVEMDTQAEPVYDAQLPEATQDIPDIITVPVVSDVVQETVSNTIVQPEIVPISPLNTVDVAPTAPSTGVATETPYGNTHF